MGSGIDFPRNRLEQLQSILGVRLQSTMGCGSRFFGPGAKGRLPKHQMYNNMAEIGVSLLDTRSFSSYSLPDSYVT